MALKPMALVSALALLHALAGQAKAELLLAGSVAFDRQAGLYTYRYVLDNRHGPGAITEVNVLFESLRYDCSLQPAAHTDPPGWSFGTSVSGGIANPPYGEAGSFWAWYNPQGLPVGGTQRGFSFTSPYAPGAGSGNNYFLYGDALGGVPPDPGVVEFGHVVAPDLAEAPEPPALALAALGLTLTAGAIRGSSARGRRRPWTAERTLQVDSGNDPSGLHGVDAR
jgi:hypothetical protein